MENVSRPAGRAYAQQFIEISDFLGRQPEMVQAMCSLIAGEPVAGKATQGGDRLARFRRILEDLTRGTLGFYEAFSRVELGLPRIESPHARSNQVFADGWAERLVRTQFSRFYNQMILEQLTSLGETRCFVPHNRAEAPDTPCSLYLAGRDHDVQAIYQGLIASYGAGHWNRHAARIPEHPHCSHVIVPHSP